MRYQLLFLIGLLTASCSFFLSSCQDEVADSTSLSTPYLALQQEMLALEYSLLTRDESAVTEHGSYVKDILSDNCWQDCADHQPQLTQLTSAIDTLLADHSKASTPRLLNQLRIVKSLVMQLNTDESYDPYIDMLWRYEEDMTTATAVAIDPMLQLYEYGEFEMIAQRMSESWQSLQHHYPSGALLGYDRLAYQRQVSHKLYLDKAMVQFQTAVQSTDWEKYDLCEAAYAVREAYRQYLSTLLIRRDRENTNSLS